ncbi:hypothetical protein K2173_011498 [Erythroxylum novogranatense]|uniref:FAS1 domain-containing protein n=1 Tax=Erythroxylum novogranatense TaxID=1862640 RepID=A0AAV8TWR2_9ROSI|nr:hypothetical protein K2173_011498 [Erythroxylum novogranatense]
MRKGWLLKNSVAFVGVVVSVCCLFVIIISVLKLPDVSLRDKLTGPSRGRKLSRDEEIGKLGKMMIEMLPEDLAFTVFVPSERAFKRDLRLQVNQSLGAEKRNDTYAIVSRILGFSTLPRTLLSTMVPPLKLVSYDSLSGLTLYISKDDDGLLVVNRIRSERINIRKGEFVVHVMDGIIMDAEFEQSVQPDIYEEEDFIETNILR